MLFICIICCLYSFVCLCTWLSLLVNYSLIFVCVVNTTGLNLLVLNIIRYLTRNHLVWFQTRIILLLVLLLTCSTSRFTVSVDSWNANTIQYNTIQYNGGHTVPYPLFETVGLYPPGNRQSATAVFEPLLLLDISFLQMYQQQLKIYFSQVWRTSTCLPCSPVWGYQHKWVYKYRFVGNYDCRHICTC